MRCFYMRNGHIQAVDFLDPDPDEALIDQARALFRKKTDQPLDGFEIWDGARRVHVHPGEDGAKDG